MRVFAPLLLLPAFLLFASCGGDTTAPASNDDPGDDDDTDDIVVMTVAEALANNAAPPADPGDDWQSQTRIPVTFQGSTVETDASGASWADGVLTLGRAGCYVLSGTLTDGRIVVDTDDDAQVTLVLDGLTAHSSTNSPLSVEDADLVLVYLAAGSSNSLSDAADYVFDGDDDEPNATLFSRDDLVIDGPGALTITANYADGIAGKDGVLILDGDIGITAADDGIRGKDMLAILGGAIDVTSEGDGLISTEDDEADLGYVYIAGGEISIDAEGDGIVGVTDVLIAGGELDITSGGGHDAASGSGGSAKGLKMDDLLIVEDGELRIDAADDGVNSNDTILISGGTLEISSGNDALHGDETLTVAGGDLTVDDCLEGLESQVLSVLAGEIRVTATDDGLNAVGSVSSTFTMSGGRVYVDAQGDGVDCNGTITMSGGTLLVCGPTSDGSSPIDYDSHFQISGGYLVAVGSQGMAQTADETSTQNALLSRFSTVSAGNLVHLQTTAGTDLCTFRSVRGFASFAFSSPDLTTGESYELYTGGTCDGTETDGLYEDGSYSPGTRITSFTVTQTVTTTD